MQASLPSHLRLSEVEWTQLRFLHMLLSPFFDATVYMSGSAYPTMPLVVAMSADLKSSLTKSIGEIQDTGDLSHTLRSQLTAFALLLRTEVTGFWNYEATVPGFPPCTFDSLNQQGLPTGIPKSRVHGEILSSKRLEIQLAASLLHPFTRSWTFVSAEVRNHANTCLLEQGNEIISRYRANNAVLSDPVQHFCEDNSDNKWSSYSKPRVVTRTPVEKDQMQLRSELTSYLAEPVADFSDFLPRGCSQDNKVKLFNIPKYWIMRKRLYPLLYLVYCSLCSCPASSIPAEEMFSLGGLIVTKMRCSLGDMRVNQLMFLQSNKRRRLKLHLEMAMLIGEARSTCFLAHASDVDNDKDEDFLQSDLNIANLFSS
jgi:hypothetical protein